MDAYAKLATNTIALEVVARQAMQMRYWDSSALAVIPDKVLGLLQIYDLVIDEPST